MKKTGLAALAALALSAALLTPPAEAKTGIRVGQLNCKVHGTVGLILGSSTTMKCSYTPASGGRTEYYTGSISKLGLDIGFTSKSYITWTVFAPGKLKQGSLAGTYGGASAQATIAVGLGANVLIGGLKKSIALQPLSISGQKGLNVALGIASMKLKYK